jgi:hypothetical protein
LQVGGEMYFHAFEGTRKPEMRQTAETEAPGKVVDKINRIDLYQ